MSNSRAWNVSNMQQVDISPITLVKVVLVIYIILSSIFNFNMKLTFLDNKVFKILLLIIIIGVIEYDLHTGILLVIAYLLLNIQLNVPTIVKVEERKLELFLASLPTEISELQSQDVSHLDVPCDNTQKNELSTDIFEYSVDTKVKPYEVFVKMMTTKDHLDNAANSAFL